MRKVRRQHGEDRQLLHLPRLCDEHRLQLVMIMTNVKPIRVTQLVLGYP